MEISNIPYFSVMALIIAKIMHEIKFVGYSTGDLATVHIKWTTDKQGQLSD